MSETPPAKSKPRWGRRIVNALATVFLVLAAIVVAYRFVPPPTTWLMLSRAPVDGIDYRWRGLNDISPNLVYAAIGAEDARFCVHKGFDVEAIQKAMAHNERVEQRGRGRLRGASTITQQTAKNVFLWSGRDWVRKGFETLYTPVIELVWGKRRIMEMYLNVAEFGPGVYGAEAGARHWFGKSARDLTPREAARMAAILPAPRRYSASAPGPYVRRRASRIQAAMGTVRQAGLATCVTG
ncbi:MAG: monofunctional biosynthetic peptidoglycan transglycosylase [Brevundimonas sp.]|nr:MAG: monofunctional biosynthetic peptidoglycan transglycosylase [Brevundimonas sp.]